MAQRRIGNPASLKDPTARTYSHAYRVDNPGAIIFVAGQNSQGPEGEVRFPNDFEAQVRASFDAIAAALAEVDATMEDVVDLTAYLLDVERDAWTYRNVRGEYFPEGSLYPTSTLLEVPRLSVYGTMVEIRAVAVRS